MKEKTLKITGMTCASCSAAVERAISQLPGTSGVNVNIATNKATFKYDEDKISISEITDAIISFGYGVETGSETTLKITGMTCASCSAAVEKAINQLSGTSDVNVNIATNKATFKYDAQVVSLSEIKKAITSLGYGVETQKKDASIDESSANELKKMKRRLIVSIVFAIPLLYIAMGHMIKLPIPKFMDPMNAPLTFALIQLILTIPVLIAGRAFFTKGFRAFIKRSPSMDTLVALGTGSSFLYGIYAIVKIYLGDHSFAQMLYFESAAVVITLVMLGKYLESLGKSKTSESIKKLMSLRPDTATVIRDEQEVIIPVDDVLVGEEILVKPGGAIPLDGVVTFGNTSIDESMLTGESMPVEKHSGSVVTGGSINFEGAIRFKVTKVGEDTALSKIIKLIEDAQGRKAPIARMADIVSKYFVPAVLVIAFLSAFIWFLTGRYSAVHPEVDFNFILNIFVSVLVIACPCALGLATPAAIMAGTGKGAELGILFKSGEALEVTHSIDTVVLDKTGTITKGKPSLTDIKVYGNLSESEFISVLASAEQSSEHPVAGAILEYAENEKIKLLATESFKAIPGRGIDAKVLKNEVLAGNIGLMDSNNIDTALSHEDVLKFSSSGKTILYVALNGKLEGIIAVADTIRPSSKEAINKLKAMGLNIYMITGDNKDTTNAIASEAGIDNILAEVLPDEKAAEITKLQAQGLKVAMVGDGINDAPALVAGDVGIAIGSGTDVAIESADVVLMGSDLNEIYNAIKLSKATMRNIRQNLFWSFIYNIAGIPFAAGLVYALGGPLITPVFAGAAMAFSSVSVVTNALRLRRFKV